MSVSVKYMCAAPGLKNVFPSIEAPLIFSKYKDPPVPPETPPIMFPFKTQPVFVPSVVSPVYLTEFAPEKPVT